FLAVLAASRGADIPEVEDVAAIEAADVPDTVAEQELRAAPDGVERPVELRVFGHPQVLAGGTAVRSGLRRRARGLLALLAIRTGGVSSEEALTELWHEAGDDAADLTYVHRAVSTTRQRLRAVLGREVEVISWGSDRYELDAGEVGVDLWRFDAAMADAARAEDAGARAVALERAAAEVTGEPLDAVDYEWALPVRERIRRRAIDALAELADIRAATDDLDGAIELIERAL